MKESQKNSRFSFENMKFLILTLMLTLTPFLSSGKSILALAFLEMTAILLFILETLNPSHQGKINLFVKLFFWTIILSPLLYLIPLSSETWQQLPGRSLYLPSVEWLEANQEQAMWLTASLVPEKTVHAILATLPLAAVFMVTAGLSQQKTLQVLNLLFIVAAIQACIALIQPFNPKAISLILSDHYNTSASQGTYLNRDHFSVLMYLLLSPAMGLIFLNFGKKNKNHPEDDKKQKSINVSLILVCFVILITVAGMASKSRMGVTLTLASLFLSLIIFSGHIGGKRTASFSITLLIAIVSIITMIGATPIINRFIAHDPSSDLRFKIFPIVSQGINDFFPVGSGPGTFQEAFRLYQPVDMSNFINHVHNDYLELIFEMGAVGIMIIGMMIISWLWGWTSIIGSRWSKSTFIKAGSGISILMVIVHISMDFILHTPANALIFIFLLSIFLRKE
ncbi:MAG TPA: O-antigen ligase family protein [Thiolinea sp.]|nr:O-antigen ligase family protein [Thiolinea sp.]